MKAARIRRYAAVLTPTGLHAVGYRRRGRTLEIARYRGEIASHPEVGDAGRGLAELLASEGARGGRVALAVAGFGSCHQLLSLPPASADLLEPIVHREMRRFFPDLFEGGEPPQISFLPAGAGRSGSDTPMREILVGAVPRATIREIRAALAEREIALEHLTIVPAAVSRLFASFVGTPETAALAIVTPNYSTVGFFHEGGLRLFTEPPPIGRDGGADAARTLTDQIDRGSLYLRQQFRGSRLRAVHLAAPDQERIRTSAAVQTNEDVAVRSFVPGETPGALLALGVALDAEDERGLNLLPAELRPPSRAERWTRGLAVAASAVLIIAASWWALMGVRSETAAAERLRFHQESLIPRTAAFARIEPVVRERQAHVVRTELLRRMVAERQRLPELLWPLQNAAPAVTVDRLTLTRSPEGFTGSLAGTARSWSSADAAATVDALYRDLIRELPGGSVTLSGLSHRDTPADEPTAPGVALGFQMSFIVPLEEGEGE